MAWIAAHWTLLLGVWAVAHSVALTVSATADPKTWYGKLAHVWAALNPLDLVKAFNAARAALPGGRWPWEAPAVLALIALLGCGISAGQVVQGVDVGLNAGICVINTVSADESAGKSEGESIADAVIKCGVSAAQASGILDAHRKAEVREGFVLKPAAK